MEAIAFYIFAAIALAASVGVVGQRNPMHSVILLIVSFGALAGLYVLLDAPFAAVTQIIIYAGAIMVLFLFVVMLLNVPREQSIARMMGWTTVKIGAVLSVVMGIEVIWAFSRIGPAWFGEEGDAATVSSVARIGSVLFTRHAFAFEATSILILVAMVGSIVLARRER